MVDRPGEAARLNALALRFFGWLMLLGAGLLLAVLATVLRLPAGPAGFLLPGTEGRHAVAGAIVPVLGAVGGTLAILGLASLLFGHRPLARPLPRVRLPWRHPRRPAAILLGGLALLILVLLRR